MGGQPRWRVTRAVGDVDVGAFRIEAIRMHREGQTFVVRTDRRIDFVQLA
jgi:hypothetical protein